MRYTGVDTVNIEDLGDSFKDSFRQIWFGEAENDAFNGLILGAS